MPPPPPPPPPRAVSAAAQVSGGLRIGVEGAGMPRVWLVRKRDKARGGGRKGGGKSVLKSAGATGGVVTATRACRHVGPPPCRRLGPKSQSSGQPRPAAGWRRGGAARRRGGSGDAGMFPRDQDMPRQPPSLRPFQYDNDFMSQICCQMLKTMRGGPRPAAERRSARPARRSDGRGVSNSLQARAESPHGATAGAPPLPRPTPPPWVGTAVASSFSFQRLHPLQARGKTSHSSTLILRHPSTEAALGTVPQAARPCPQSWSGLGPVEAADASYDSDVGGSWPHALADFTLLAAGLTLCI